MKINDWLSVSTQKLNDAGVESARLDCLVLLEDALEVDRGRLLAHPEFIIEDSTLGELDKKLDRRANYEPLAYIRGFSEFYGRKFLVNEHVLTPRPETETMIDLLKPLVQGRTFRKRFVITGANMSHNAHELGPSLHIVDVGTGSGCLAITAKLEFPQAEVTATDIDSKALKVATKNASALKAGIKFLQGSLLLPLYAERHTPYAILANLPYVPDSLTINKAAQYEPAQAIFGGADGLDYYRQMFAQIQDLKDKPQAILTESLSTQHDALALLAKNTGYKLQKTSGLVQLYKLST